MRPRSPFFVLPMLLALSGCVADVVNGRQDEGVVALFNPAASPAVVPTPTDLVRQGGRLQIPVDPAEATTPALKSFNDYLRGLDGFPPDSTSGTTFSGALDPASLAEGVVVYDATDRRVLPSTEVQPLLAEGDAGRLVVQSKGRWRGGHTYVVALLSWQDDTRGMRGLRSDTGQRVLADQAFSFLRSGRSLLGLCTDRDNPACACPGLTDPSCRAVVDGLALPQARQLEAVRLGLAAPLDAILAHSRRARADVALAWSFTISARPFAVFDVGRGQIPFPSELLLANPLAELGAGKTTVNLPIPADDPPLQKALKGGLNTLDGFSTTASAQFPVDTTAEIDAATVTPRSALLLNASTPSEQPAYTPRPLVALLDKTTGRRGFAGQIWLTPDRPLLGDQNLYVAVLTTAIRDAQGQALTPSPTTLLLTQPGPLVVDGRSAVPSIPLADAARLELLRQAAIAPLVKRLGAIGVTPAQVAGLTAFRTQSIAAPLLALSAAVVNPAQPVPTDVIIDQINKAVPQTMPKVAALVYGRLPVLQLVEDRGPINLQRAQVRLIPFVLALPSRATTATAKVVMVQHGIGRWRADALLIANELAGRGLATLAIDVIYHGARVVCVNEGDCAAGVSCVRAQAQDPAGTCAGGRYKTQANTPTLPGTTDAQPAAELTNRDFSNFANLFAVRDNLRQHTVDLTQLTRVAMATDGRSLRGQLAARDATLPTLDSAAPAFLGQSLGAILGTTFLAVNPYVRGAVLNVGGAPITGIYSDPRSQYSGALLGFFKSIGVDADTPEYHSLLDTLRWILDPGDPINLARHVRQRPLTSPLTGVPNAPKRVILQEAGEDTSIPNQWTYRLGVELGLPVDAQDHLLGIDGEGGAQPVNVSTFFLKADHGVIFNYADRARTEAVQQQASTYLESVLLGRAPKVIASTAN